MILATTMKQDAKLKKLLLSQVTEAHGRYREVLEERLAKAEVEDIERYFGLLSRLVDKLEDDRKTLRQVAREMVTESAAQIIAELA